MESDKTNSKIEELKLLAKFMDNQYKIPFFNLAFGWDSIIGIIPGFGDIFTALITIYLLIQAFIMKVPLIVLIRMLINIILDTSLGIIPLFGDVFDFFYKSNLKNINLLENYLQKEKTTIKFSCLYVFLFGFILSVIMLLLSGIIFITGYSIYHLFLNV